MFNVAILTPSSGICRFKYAQSLANLVLYFCTHEVDEEMKEQGISLGGQQSFSTSCNREMLVDGVIEKDFTHILFIDDDMKFEPDILHVLARKKKDIVVANYKKKLQGEQEWVATGLNKRDIRSQKHCVGLEEALHVGFGLSLISLEVFKKIEKPWFPVPYNLSTSNYVSEDYMFCRAAREAGYKIYVDHDASRRVKHIGDYEY